MIHRYGINVKVQKIHPARHKSFELLVVKLLQSSIKLTLLLFTVLRDSVFKIL